MFSLFLVLRWGLLMLTYVILWLPFFLVTLPLIWAPLEMVLLLPQATLEIHYYFFCLACTFFVVLLAFVMILLCLEDRFLRLDAASIWSCLLGIGIDANSLFC